MSTSPGPSPLQDSRADSATAEVFRKECYRCFRAASVCICDRVPVIDNRTGVLVFQHHRELLHPIGTARIARLGFKNVSVHVARRQQQLTIDMRPPDNCSVLYPATDAINVSRLAPEHHPSHLIVLDGTWSQAARIYRANPWLHELPHLAIDPAAPSRYRVRKQPRAGCLSTIEALVFALRIIEPGTRGFDQLLDVFESMVDDQIRFENESRSRS
ncbi:MAG: tRNA-uridine aminocarboxypropyltransferase [Pirellulaceae bacterium]